VKTPQNLLIEKNKCYVTTYIVEYVSHKDIKIYRGMRVVTSEVATKWSIFFPRDF